MSKLGFGNFLGSLITAVSWLLTFTASGIGVHTRSRGLVMLAGLSTLLLWVCNFTGVILGLVASLQDKKDWKAWVGLGLHAAQLGFASLIFVLGVFVQAGSHNGVGNIN